MFSSLPPSDPPLRQPPVPDLDPQVLSGEWEPPRPPPPRSGCLSAFLIVEIVLDILSLLAVLLAGSYHEGPDPSLAAIAPLAFLSTLLEIACLVGIWQGRRWGVYGLVALTIAGLFVNRLLAGNFLNDVLGLLQLGLLIALVYPIWDQFEPQPDVIGARRPEQILALLLAGVVYGALVVLPGLGRLPPHVYSPAPAPVSQGEALPTHTPFPLRSGPLDGCPGLSTPVGSDTVLCAGMMALTATTPTITWVLTDRTYHFGASGGDGDQITIDVQGTDWWKVTFAAEPNNLFHLGSYLVPHPDNSGYYSAPGVGVTGPQIPCPQRRVGRFTVLELTYDWATQQLQHFAANFDEYCYPGVIVSGAVRFRSVIPVSADAPPPPSPTATPTPVPIGTGPLVVAACQTDPSLQGLPTYLCLDSSPGERLGGGQQWRLDGSVAGSYASPLYGNVLTISFDTPSQDTWTVSFWAGATRSLLPHLYTNLDPTAYAQDVAPGLYLSRHNAGCLAHTGRFEVLENTGTPPDDLHFAANFEHHCDGGPPLLGVLRYHSTVPP